MEILRAVGPGECYSTVPCVRPGGESLLRLASWAKVEKVLQAIDAVEALGIDPADAAPEHWRHIHNRLAVGERPRPYTRSRHQAWLRNGDRRHLNTPLMRETMDRLSTTSPDPCARDIEEGAPLGAAAADSKQDVAALTVTDGEEESPAAAREDGSNGGFPGNWHNPPR